MSIDQRTDAVHGEILGFLPPDLMDLSDLAVGVERVMGLLGAAPADLPDTISVTDHIVPAGDGHELLVRTYRPTNGRNNSPALFWIHGGGLVLGAVAMDDAHCADFAEQLDIVVASVEYRLSPAHPYPTPLDDCHAGLSWLFANADELGIDAERIALGGGSAGGGLAAGLALRVRDAGAPSPCFQLLRYPMIDDRNTTRSSHSVTDQRVWHRAANLVGWGAYLGEAIGTDSVPPEAAASRATDLSGLPPAMISVGDLDMFLDEDLAYASALIDAGVPTELHVYPGCFHGSDAMVAHAPQTQQWRNDDRAALRRAFGDE